ncbi:MAG: type II toxin-antitoxin system HipA family toxin [Flavobacteriaceae bacterium]
MISKVTPTECFVYITLPGQTAPVTAARFELTKERRDVAIGRLVYGRSYLARAEAVPIDPIELRLAGQTYETVGMKGLFGALRDAGPDYWGRRVIERHVGAAQLNEMDYLLHSPDDRAGALGFGLNQQPPAPKRDFNKTLSLPRLQTIADAIVDEEDRPDDAEAAQVEELLLVGTSMGGARPKAVVEDTDGLWIAKFNRKDDKWNSARAEHAMLVLARACGVTTAESKVIVVGGRDVLMVKRFDRERADGGYLRARMLSGLTLLRAEEGHDTRDRWSYVLLVEELRRISANPRADAVELFRRMCFNALISNTDDHPRNHAVMAMTPNWKLSPAYDLTPTPLISEERRDLAMICGDAGRYANAENIVSQSMRFLLEKGEAEKIVSDMEEQVRNKWYEVARREGLSEADCNTISRSFVYPGFRLPMSRAAPPA